MAKFFAFRTKRNGYLLIFYAFLFLFVLLKIPYLSLPFYWDEAWSYAMAIFDMAQNGPTLIPGHANEWFTRGHPLMYYFLSSSWLRIFGTNLLSAHIFSLLISVIALLSIFYVFGKILDSQSALFISLAVAVQSMFLSQSTLLLPEIFLMLLSVWVFYSYISKKWFLYIFFSTILVLSKETALILILVILFDKIFLSKLLYLSDSENNKNFIKELTILFIPVLVFVMFLLIQKRNLGYLFYPEHISMTNFDLHSIKNNFINYGSQLIWSHTRYIWLFMALISLGYAIATHNKLPRQLVHFLILSLFFIIAYLIFSSINFFTNRYLLTLLPFYFFIVITLVAHAIEKKKYVAIVLSVFLIVNLINTYALKGEGDCELSFRNTVICHREAVNYCETKNYYDYYVNTGFLMSFNLKYPHLGYLKSEK